jgi:hypothetical protein
MKRPYTPRPVVVEVSPRGDPRLIQGRRVAQVKEEWLVEDGWWTRKPLRRHYFELVLGDGRNVVVYRDESDDSKRWYLQRA